MVCDCIMCKNMLSKLTATISYMLSVGPLIHKCYLVIFTGKRTGFFYRYICSTNSNKHLAYSALPQHLKCVVIDKNPNRLLHGAKYQ